MYLSTMQYIFERVIWSPKRIITQRLRTTDKELLEDELSLSHAVQWYFGFIMFSRNVHHYNEEPWGHSNHLKVHEYLEYVDKFKGSDREMLDYTENTVLSSVHHCFNSFFLVCAVLVWHVDVVSECEFQVAHICISRLDENIGFLLSHHLVTEPDGQ